MQRKQVGILVFLNVEALDFCGPYEVFTATRLEEEQRRKRKEQTPAVLRVDGHDADRAHRLLMHHRPTQVDGIVGYRAVDQNMPLAQIYIGDA